MAPACIGHLPQKRKPKSNSGDFDADHGFAFDGVGRPAH
jgi:hypothetical protein